MLLRYYVPEYWESVIKDMRYLCHIAEEGIDGLPIPDVGKKSAQRSPSVRSRNIKDLLKPSKQDHTTAGRVDLAREQQEEIYLAGLEYLLAAHPA